MTELRRSGEGLRASPPLTEHVRVQRVVRGHRTSTAAPARRTDVSLAFANRNRLTSDDVHDSGDYQPMRAGDRTRDADLAPAYETCQRTLTEVHQWL